jgi:hypothetical protein
VTGAVASLVPAGRRHRDGGRPHGVGTFVDNEAGHVDSIPPSTLVHLADVRLRMTDGLSSTGARFLGTSVSGGSASSSPASTAAKTTDENLYSMRDNDKSGLAVDRVDGGCVPPVERSSVVIEQRSEKS